jgi:circadian clock protein KaiB
MATPDPNRPQIDRSVSSHSEPRYVLRLYVSGASIKSLAAIRNIRNICQANLSSRYTLEVVDIYQQPERAVRDQVVAAPMLVKERPLPRRQVIGTLSNMQRVMRILGLSTPDVERANGAPERG